MDTASYLRLIRGESRGIFSAVARAGLTVASLGYAAGVSVRNRGFDRGRRPVERVEVPVVSVGNLTLGGTGKTPMVEFAARWLRRQGRRVAILSRGYGQEGGLNDEGRVLEENLPDVPHLQDRDRVKIARIAVEELEAEVLVLDDGFQHRRLARDLDLVLLDALDPFGQGRLFPRGLLREPVASLRRAGVVVLSRADLVDEDRRRAIRREAERGAGPIGLAWVEARHAPIDLVDADGQTHPLSDLDGRAVLAFCGLGNPEGFRRTLEGLEVELRGFRAFPDHHPYDAARRGRADRLGARAWRRSGLDHPEGFGEAARRCSRVGAAPRVADRPGDRRGGRGPRIGPGFPARLELPAAPLKAHARR